MTYDSLDKIPCKVFFKISETGDFSLLSDKKIGKDKLKEIWENLEKEHKEEGGEDAKSNKLFSVFKQIAILETKILAINSIIRYLWVHKDEDLIEKLRGYGYSYDEKNHYSSLRKSAKKTSGISVKIERLKKRLPKKPEKSVSIDQVIYGYASAAEISISDTDKVTMRQYHAIKKLGEQRIKSMKDGGVKS